MAKLRVHLMGGPEESTAASLAPLLDDGIKLTEGSGVPAETQILIGGVPSRDQLAAPGLTSLIIPWAGLPRRTGDLLAEFPHIQAHNLHHNAPMVSEITVALLLAAAKLVVPLDQALRRGDWSRGQDPDRSVLLAGRTCLILGYGAIGRRVAPHRHWGPLQAGVSG